MATIPERTSSADLPGAASSSMSADVANQPFHVRGAVYTSGDDTLTVTVGAGRVDWGGGTVTEFTEDTEGTLTPVSASTTYHVHLLVDDSIEISTSVEPSSRGVRLATVATDAAKEPSVTDMRGMLPAPPELAYTLAGADSVEGTQAGTTEADVVTISGLSIPVESPVLVTFSMRKTSGAGSFASFGLKINATAVFDRVDPAARSTATDQAESGSCRILIPPRSANYLVGPLVEYVFRTTAGVAAASVDGGIAYPELNAPIPNAAITDIAISAYSGNVAVTAGVKDVRVYALAGS